MWEVNGFREHVWREGRIKGDSLAPGSDSCLGADFTLWGGSGVEGVV